MGFSLSGFLCAILIVEEGGLQVQRGVTIRQDQIQKLIYINNPLTRKLKCRNRGEGKKTLVRKQQLSLIKV